MRIHYERGSISPIVAGSQWRAGLLVIMFAVLPVAATGIMTSGRESLGLQQAVETALKQNPSVLAARREVDAAHAKYRGASALSRPCLSLSPSASGISPTQQFLLFSQPLEINGQRTIRTRIAGSEAAAAREDANVIEREVINNVKRAYWDIAAAQSIVDVNRDGVGYVQSFFDTAKRREAGGGASPAHAITFEVELERFTLELASAESALAKCKFALNALLGRSVEQDFVLADALQFTPLDVEPTRLARQAQANRPELAEAQALLAARREGIRAVSIARRPDLALQVSKTSIHAPITAGVGLTFSWVDWGSLGQQGSQARASAAAQAERLAAMQITVGLDLRAALIDAHRYETRVRAYQDRILARSKQLLDMARTGYDAGTTSYPEALEALRTYRSVNVDYDTALADYQKALGQIAWAAGIGPSPNLACMTTVGGSLEKSVPNSISSTVR